LEQLKADYGDDMRIIFRHLPLLNIHSNAQITAEAAEAAGAQGKFWELHDLLFKEQDNWNSLSESDIIDVLVDYAEEVGVEDLDQFKTDLEEGTYTDIVTEELTQAVNAQINSTPTFVVNRVLYPAQAFGLSYQGLEAFSKLMGLRENWFAEPEQVIEPDKEYIATIQTEKGDIVVELFPDTAPVNVNSFAFLAEQGWYKDNTFHRVLPDFVAQGGDPTNTGVGFPGYRCSDEVTPKRSFDKAGLLSLANSGPNTNGSQFFITYGPTPNLNANFTIIGQVIEGMDIAEQITPRDPQQNPDAAPGDTIIDIIIEEKS
ncbi:MAG: peptidylprolyl isomerase, partial [Anaerolineae bacterium]|nr:peptidylprolyl isomerase [Anaerolineae bacterium]